MRVVKSVAEMAEVSRELRASGKTVGFVPTMGYLHAGHISLVKAARKDCGSVVLSIFVNPAQFGQGEDLGTYPRNLAGDVEKCRMADVDVVFAPEAAEMYPAGYATYVTVEGISDRLCGASRPGHFRGVATVVTRLFNIVRPHRAYFGQKDFQQTVVIKRLVRDLMLDVEVVTVPTVREPDGLAMSSRNSYLSPAERMASVQIYRSLASARSLRESGETRAGVLTQKVRENLSHEPMFKAEYVELVDADTLLPVQSADGRCVIVLAVRLGRTRLIDNMPL
ncbi:MAG: pantoate--beta-alanine ligase [Nitrospirae bacterium]|nr:pantoate--beta-alanine ligase [Nitrospirota bacterium]